MALSKTGKTEMTTVLVWVAVALLLAYVVNFNGFQNTVNNLFGSRDVPSTSGNVNVGRGTPPELASCPTTGTTTYTLNVQNALTSTATNVIAEYFVFDNNKLVKEGVTDSTGTASFEVSCGKNYKLVLLNSTIGTGLYSKVIDLQARTARDTVNEKLVAFGGARILSIENPADPARSPNVSLSAGATKNFELKFVANVTDRGFNRPIIMCQANVTSIQRVAIGSFSDGTQVVPVTNLPRRVTASAGYQYYAWEYPKMLTPTMGVITASGSITAQSSTAPSTSDSMSCRLVDQATWKTSSYKTASSPEEAFKTGPENTETLADVGAPDSSVAFLYFTSTGGY